MEKVKLIGRFFFALNRALFLAGILAYMFLVIVDVTWIETAARALVNTVYFTIAIGSLFSFIAFYFGKSKEHLKLFYIQFIGFFVLIIYVLLINEFLREIF